MSLRRLAPAVLVAGVLLTSTGGPAFASFDRTVSGQLGASTITVTPPTGVTTTGSSGAATCSTSGTGTLTYTARVNWTASTTSRGISGYRIAESVNGVARTPVTVASTVATFQRSATRPRNATATHTFVITTLTSYTWTTSAAAVTYTC